MLVCAEVATTAVATSAPNNPPANVAEERRITAKPDPVRSSEQTTGVYRAVESVAICCGPGAHGRARSSIPRRCSDAPFSCSRVLAAVDSPVRATQTPTHSGLYRDLLRAPAPGLRRRLADAAPGLPGVTATTSGVPTAMTSSRRNLAVSATVVVGVLHRLGEREAHAGSVPWWSARPPSHGLPPRSDERPLPRGDRSPPRRVRLDGAGVRPGPGHGRDVSRHRAIPWK